MGGIGKTELAIQYSLKYLKLNKYPGGICWINAREKNIGLQIINFVRKYLDLKPPEDLELPDKVGWSWAHWREGNTLIILDDVKNYSDIKAYLTPQASQFKVLITTRLNLTIPDPLNLEVLSETEALELLSQLINSQQVQKEYQKARELCQRLGYLPLALQLVGIYIKKKEISLSEELQRLEKKGLTHASMDISKNKSSWTHNIKRGIIAAFELSWEELDKSAQELGCLLSLFALTPIPWSLVENTNNQQDEEELEDARDELKNLHLLQGKKPNYKLHQLIQEFFQDKQSKSAITEEQKHNLCSAMVAIAENIPQTITLTQINDLIPFIPHLIKTASTYQKWLSDQDLLPLFIGIARFYESQGAYEQALPWGENCLSATRKRLGEEHPHVVTSLNNLALLYDEQGRYSEAEPLYLKALEIIKKLPGEEHPLVATSLNNLANLYDHQGRYEAAEPLYQQALKIYEKTLGEEHHNITNILDNLTLFYDHQGRYEEAKHCYQQALKIRKKTLGETNLTTVNYQKDYKKLINSQN